MSWFRYRGGSARPGALVECDTFETGVCDYTHNVLVPVTDGVRRTLWFLEIAAIRVPVSKTKPPALTGERLFSDRKPCSKQAATWLKHAICFVDVPGHSLAKHVGKDTGSEGKIDRRSLGRKRNITVLDVAMWVVVAVPNIDVMKLKTRVSACNDISANLHVNVDDIEPS